MRIIAWAGGLIFALCLVAFITLRWLAVNEDICLDRKPWWGPPNDPNVYTSCSGHMWERHEAGYGWFGGPK
jgi:hypothetical protein